LELEVSGTVFKQGDLYGDVKVVVKNVGGTRHLLQSAERSVNWPPFEPTWRNTWSGSFTSSAIDNKIEPGETIDDTQYWRIQHPASDILWIKLSLRVVSNGVEWTTSCLIRSIFDGTHQ